MHPVSGGPVAAADDDGAQTERAPARSHRRRVVVVLAVVFVLAYGSLLWLYAVSGRTRGVTAPTAAPAGGVHLDIKVEKVDGAARRLTIGIDVTPDRPLLGPSGVALDRTLTIVVDPAATTRSLVLPEGQVPSVNHVDLVLDGNIRSWPLDKYGVEFGIGVYEGSPRDGRLLDTTTSVGGRVHGWRVTIDDKKTIGPEGGFHVFDLDARRSGDTLAFAVIMLLVLVALPATALFVVLRTRRDGRAIQPTFMSWIAAMLFATIPLRNFLPGNPPAGSWIDAVIVLWVIVGLVTALALYVAGWQREGSSRAP